MRCVDVIRELSVPSAGVDGAELSGHLAHCPECAAWAARNAKLDRLWGATSPVSPSTAAWDSVWAQISDALEREPAPAEILPFLAAPASGSRLKPRASWIFWIAQTAAAAAVLVMVVAHFRFGTPKPQMAQNPAPAVAIPPTALAHNTTPRVEKTVTVTEYEYEFEQGQLPIIRFDTAGKSVQTTDLALNESPIRVDSAYEALNEWEGGAGDAMQ